jgi:hypothetical protein
MERHQTVGEGIYRVRFGNANGFIASSEAFVTLFVVASARQR